jgi:hypothetical protein
MKDDKILTFFLKFFRIFDEIVRIFIFLGIRIREPLVTEPPDPEHCFKKALPLCVLFLLFMRRLAVCRVLQQIFDEPNPHLTIRVSFLEIFNDQGI